jgi:hypothetical protein
MNTDDKFKELEQELEALWEKIKNARDQAEKSEYCDEFNRKYQDLKSFSNWIH